MGEWFLIFYKQTMHDLYLGLVSKDTALTSLKARQYLFSWLENKWFTNWWWYAEGEPDAFFIWWRWSWVFQWKIKEDWDNLKIMWDKKDWVILTEDIADRLLLEYPETKIVDTETEDEEPVEYIDIKNYVDKYWIVAVDYHY